MKKYLLPAFVLLSTVASAQVPTLPQTYTLTLSPQQTDYVYTVLTKRPYDEAQPLLDLLRAQISQQNAAEQAKTAKPKDPPTTDALQPTDKPKADAPVGTKP
jgi:hypothetical protein